MLTGATRTRNMINSKYFSYNNNKWALVNDRNQYFGFSSSENHIYKAEIILLIIIGPLKTNLLSFLDYFKLCETKTDIDQIEIR